MVRPLVGTSILIDCLDGIGGARDALARYAEPATSIATWMEVLVGADPGDEPATRRVLSRFTMVAVDRAVAERAVLARRERRIRLPDAIVQASAEVHSMLLVTRDTRDFDPASPSVRVPDSLWAALRSPAPRCPGPPAPRSPWRSPRACRRAAPR